MRRMLLLFVLFATLACARPLIDPRPIPDPLAPQGNPPAGPLTPSGVPDCHQISRTRCDTTKCGPNLDYVIYQCANGRQSRCEANWKCGTR